MLQKKNYPKQMLRNLHIQNYALIEALDLDFSTSNSQFSTMYDLSGCRVLDMKGVKGGIYIVNGKKVLIK